MFSAARGLAVVILCAIVPLSPALAAAATSKSSSKLDIAVVDVRRILRESLATRAIRPQMEKLKKDYQDRFRKQENELRAANQDLHRQRTILSPEAYEAQRKAFQRRATAVQREVQAAQQQLDRALARSMGKVHRALQLIVAKYAEEKRVKLILPKSGVLLMETRLDITDEILKRLNGKLPTVKVELPKMAGAAQDAPQAKGRK